MVLRHTPALVWLALLSSGLSGTCLAADPAPGDAAGMAVIRGSDKLATMTMGDLDKLQAIQVTPSFGGRGGQPATFEGPLLWTVLSEAHAVTFAKMGDQVRQVVSLTGSDGYTAVLGLGEISPDFEGKQVILAERMDGKPLGPDHLRVVIPGDMKGGRSVRNIVAVGITPLPAAVH